MIPFVISAVTLMKICQHKYSPCKAGHTGWKHFLFLTLCACNRVCFLGIFKLQQYYLFWIYSKNVLCVKNRERVKMCFTWIVSTSPSTVTRDSTPCWKNAHITTCITTHFSPSRHSDSAVVWMVCIHVFSNLSLVSLFFILSVLLLKLTRQQLLLIPALFPQHLLPLLLLLFHYLSS